MKYICSFFIKIMTKIIRFQNIVSWRSKKTFCDPPPPPPPPLLPNPIFPKNTLSWRFWRYWQQYRWKSLQCTLRLAYMYVCIDGWVISNFTSFSKVFQSYPDNGRLIMKGCGQWNLGYSWKDFLLHPAAVWFCQSIGCLYGDSWQAAVNISANCIEWYT